MQYRWNYVKPHLPKPLGWLWGGIYTLREPSRVMSPVGSYLPKPSFGSFDRVFEALWIATPITKVLFQIFVRPFQVSLLCTSTEQKLSVL